MSSTTTTITVASVASTTVTGELTAKATEEAVAKAKDQQIRQSAIATAGPEFVESVGNSQLFRLDWDQLLCAAPTSVSILGACILAANSETARTITLTSSDKPLKGFRSISLNGCLIEVVNQGSHAFRSADTNMGLISLISGKITGPQTGPGGLDMQDSLADQMKLLKKAADDCLSAAKNIDDDFSRWLDLVSELHRAAIERQGSAEEQSRQAKLDIAATSVRVDIATDQQKAASEAVALLKDTMQTTQDAFKKASDSYPSGWDVIGMEFVSGLTQTFLAGANNIVNKKTGGKQNKNTGKTGNTESNGHSQSGHAQPSVLPENSTDPVYEQIHTYMTAITSLKAVVTAGPNHGPDWDEIVNPKNDRTALSFLKTMQQMASSSIGANTTSLPGQMYKGILSDWASIVGVLEGMTNGARGISWKSPDAKSAAVVDIVSRTNTLYENATALNSTAKTASGMSGGQMPMVAKCNSQDSSSGRSTSTSEQILSSATNRLNTTQAAFTAAQQNYQKSADTLVAVDGQLGQLKASLGKLQSEKMTYDEIKGVLAQGIAMVIDLKAQVAKLLQFFDSVSTLILFVTEYQVGPFLQFLQRQQDKLEGGSIAGLTFSDFQRQTIFTSAITIRAYYQVFGRISSMYGNISKDNIMPGMQMVNEFSKPGLTPDQVTEKSNELTNFSDKATRNIKAAVSSVQADLKSQLSKMVTKSSQDIALLPPAPEFVKKAIESGKNVNTDAVAQGLADYKTVSSSVDLVF
ncbi:hypothetical protein SLS64_012268 [Diaporthe eres]|uniref:Uncharacterized protein n=1 Tax=Diaporthe eres TaxID=83184 RepID=A0ABR1P2K5_DIAER